jgi:hypothetical protein
MNRFNPKTLLIAIAILAIAIYFGLPKILDTEIGKKLNLQKKTQESVSVSRVMLPDAPPNIESTSPPLPIPSNELANGAGAALTVGSNSRTNAVARIAERMRFMSPDCIRMNAPN